MNFVARDGRLAGLISLADVIRPSSRETVRLSRATMRNIKQNLFFAFIYNGVGVPIAAGLLYPFLGVLLSPIVASAAMAASSISVVLNALRLAAFRMPAGPTVERSPVGPPAREPRPPCRRPRSPRGRRRPCTWLASSLPAGQQGSSPWQTAFHYFRLGGWTAPVSG